MLKRLKKMSGSFPPTQCADESELIIKNWWGGIDQKHQDRSLPSASSLWYPPHLEEAGMGTDADR